MGKKFFSISLTIILAVSIHFLYCSHESISGSNGPVWEYGDIIKDTMIDCSVQDVVISCPGKISIFIPAGIINRPAQLKIRELDSYPESNDDHLKMLKVYDVTIDSLHFFQDSLQITFPYEIIEAQNGIFGNRVGAAWYLDSLKKWHTFSDVKIDSINRTISFFTNHLTKLGKFGWNNLQGFTDFYNTVHFTIYWTENKVPSNSMYLTPYPAMQTGTDPHFISDMGYYLEQAYDTIVKNGLSLPSKIDVYVQDISPDDGRASFLGYIMINNTFKNGKSLTDALPSVCAHELLHISQDYYYMQLFSEYTSKWWLEATAVLADRMVWPAKTVHEAESYADEVLINQLHNPWDDCNSDPEYYTAGGFLSYLSAFRTGNKLNVPQIIKECGKATTVSYIRTILDEYIKSTLGGSGIGQEYCNYIIWAQSQNGHIDIQNSAPVTKGGNFNCVTAIFPYNTEMKSNILTLQRLSVRYVKVKPSDTTISAVSVSVPNKDPDIYCAVYVSSPAGTFLSKVMESGDSTVVGLKPKTEWVDILCVNKHKDNAASITINTRAVMKPFITSISPSEGKPGDIVTINGVNLGDNIGDTLFFGSIKATSISSWTQKSIKATVPAGAHGCLVSVKSDNITSNLKQFTITGIPQITSVGTYSTVNRAGNSIFDLSGTGFGFTQGKVFFGSAEAQVVSNQWGDKIIKIRIPFDAIVDSITVITANGQPSTPYYKDYISIPEYLNNMKEFDVYIAGTATFMWNDCNGAGSETKKVYTGASPTGMDGCVFSPFAYSCSTSTNSADIKTNVYISVNHGTRPGLTTISGTCTKICDYGSNPDGASDMDVYTVSFKELPLYDTLQCQFGIFGPGAVNYFTSIDLKEYRWNEACSTTVIRSANTLTCTDSTYRGDGVMVNIIE